MAKPKQPRKEVVSFRLEPKIKYLVDIAARVQRRSPTNYIEYTLEQSLKNVMLIEGDTAEDRVSVYDEGNHLWSESEAHRVMALDINFPDLLSHEESEILRTIRYSFEDLFCPTKHSFNYELVEQFWDVIKKYVAGDQQSINYLNILKRAVQLSSHDNKEYISWAKSSLSHWITAIDKHQNIKENIYIHNMWKHINSFGYIYAIDQDEELSHSNVNYDLLAKDYVNILLASHSPPQKQNHAEILGLFR